jgi:hypothetical protein
MRRRSARSGPAGQSEIRNPKWKGGAMLASVGCFETAIIVALAVGFFGGAVVALLVRIKRGAEVRRRGGQPPPPSEGPPAGGAGL